MIAIGIFDLALLLRSTDEVPSSLEAAEQIDEDTKAFERLSFWQKLLQESDAQTIERRSVLDGLSIDHDTDEKVVSVMIDNFTSAQEHHSGVRSASIVYEALAEGGITRLMLIFPYQDLNRVGPVRSARDYFVDFAEEYGGIYAHAGGSPTALEQLWGSARVYDLDEDERLTGNTYSFRDPLLSAPHDLFFDLLLARERAEDLGYQLSSTNKTWCFDETSPTGTNISNIELNFSHDASSSYYVEFEYDSQLDSYRRYYGSSNRTPHIDQYDDLQIAPKNLIVQVSPSYLIDGDEKERIQIEHIGQGTAFIYRDGKKITGSWEKQDLESPTEYFDLLGNEICVSPGQTWISIVDDASLVLDR